MPRKARTVSSDQFFKTYHFKERWVLTGFGRENKTGRSVRGNQLPFPIVNVVINFGHILPHRQPKSTAILHYSLGMLERSCILYFYRGSPKTLPLPNAANSSVRYFLAVHRLLCRFSCGAASSFEVTVTKLPAGRRT
jgi:hypothetical protein